MKKLRVTSYELQGTTICSMLKNETVTICNGLKLRGESPVINSVGHRPTERGTKRPTERRIITTTNPQRGVIKLNRTLPYHNSTNRALPYPNDFGLSAHFAKLAKSELSHNLGQLKITVCCISPERATSIASGNALRNGTQSLAWGIALRINSVEHRPTERGVKLPTESNTYRPKALKGRNQLCFKSLK